MNLTETIANAIADAILDGRLKPERPQDFISSVAGIDYTFDVSFEEDWSEPYPWVTDEMGRSEMGSDFYGYCHLKIDYTGAYDNEGDYLHNINVNVPAITKIVREKINERA